jgi:hypothetical protein
MRHGWLDGNIQLRSSLPRCLPGLSRRPSPSQSFLPFQKARNENSLITVSSSGLTKRGLVSISQGAGNHETLALELTLVRYSIPANHRWMFEDTLSIYRFTSSESARR